jgi:hypothetical protein
VNGFLIYLLRLLKIQCIFLVPYEKGLISPAKGLPFRENRSPVPYTFQALRWTKENWKTHKQSGRHDISGVGATFLAFDTTLVSQFGPFFKKNLNNSRL